MPVIADYMADNGLSDESMAELLTIKLGREDRPVKAHGVLAIRNRKDENVPKSWLDALDIELPEFIKESPLADGDEQPPLGGASGTGSSPPSLPVPVDLPFDGLEARKRIELVYVGVGKGVAAAMRDKRIEIIFAQHAPKLADKWIAAARQNARVAQVITYVTAGGATGDLVIAHVMLVVSLLMISGKVPVSGIGSLLGPDAVVPDARTVPERRPPQQAEGGPGGSEEPGAVRAVVDDAEAPPL